MRYTNEQEFIFTAPMNGQYRTITVKANGGSVTLYAWDEVEWIATGDFFNEDGAYQIFTSNQTLKVVPAGGATYSWSE